MINVVDLFKSAKWFEKKLDNKVLEVLDRPGVQNALWETVKDTIKAKTNKEIEFKETEIEIAQREADEATKKLNSFKEEKAKLIKSLNDDLNM